MELKVEIDYGTMSCHGCLSTGRYMSSISQEYCDLFNKLRTDDINYQKIDLQLCWECIAFLNKCKQFRTRITTAQSILRQHFHHINGDVKPEIITLSSLKSIHIKTYNKEYNEDDNEVNEEPNIFYELQLNEEKDDIRDFDPVDIKTEVECDIKDDYSDKDHSDEEYSDKQHSDEEYSDKEHSDEEYSDKERSDKEHSDNDNDSDYMPIRKKKRSEKSTQNNIEKMKKVQKPQYSSRANYKIYSTVIKKDRIVTENYIAQSIPICLTPTEYEAHLEKNGIKGSNLNKQLIHQCKECTSTFLKLKDLRRHACCFHKQIFPKKCYYCSIQLTSSEHSEDHWTNVHTKMLKCVLCGEICRKHEIKKHTNKLHSQTFKCNKCGEEFGLFAVFVKHYKKVHKSFLCKDCNAIFTSRESLLSHTMSHHTPACNICNRKFKNRNYYQNHMRITHPELIVKKKGHQDINKELSYCVECNKQFPSLQKYKVHLETSSIHNPERKQRVPCPECGKMISSLFLQNHIKITHLKVTKHYCKQCDKYYARATGLQEHVARFHKKIPPPKNKMCVTCGKGFSTNRILLNHRRTHTGERPFQCKYCPAAFAQVTAMKNHQKNQHEKHNIK